MALDSDECAKLVDFTSCKVLRRASIRFANPSHALSVSAVHDICQHSGSR